MNHNCLLVGLSATANNNDQNQGFNYGMNIFIHKPANLKLLLLILSELKSNNCKLNSIQLIKQTLSNTKDFKQIESAKFNF